MIEALHRKYMGISFCQKKNVVDSYLKVLQVILK